MKNTRILLVSFMPRLANQGLAYVAATLQLAGFPVSTLTIPSRRLRVRELGALVAFCTEQRPHLIGMGLMTPDLPRAQALTTALKEARPDLPVLWGGIHPTLAPDDALRHADMVCVGEGEGTALELAQRLEQGRDFSDVRGLQQLYAAIGERRHIRRRSVGNVMAELENARARLDGLRMVAFSDDSFLLMKDEAWLEEFCDQYRRRIGLPFFCKAIPRYVTRERIGRLQQAGLEHIEIGLQANERVNREVFGRRQSDAAFVAAAHVLEEAGIVRHYDVILHNPYMSEDDLRRTADVLLSVRKPYSVNYYPLTFFPGTALHARARADGIPHREPDECRWDKPVAGLPTGYRHYARIFFLIPYLPSPVLRYCLRRVHGRWVRAGLAVISVSYLSLLRRLMGVLRRQPWLYYGIIRPLYRAADRLGGARRSPA
ncbi:MAG: cobalamin-dependent protein [Candidatus Latescibacterota bacterium]